MAMVMVVVVVGFLSCTFFCTFIITIITIYHHRIFCLYFYFQCSFQPSMNYALDILSVCYFNYYWFIFIFENKNLPFSFGLFFFCIGRSPSLIMGKIYDGDIGVEIEMVKEQPRTRERKRD